MDNSKVKKFRIKKSPRLNLSFLTLIAVIIIFYLIGFTTNSIQREIYAQNRQKRLDEAISFCDSLFDEKHLKKSETTADSLKDCDERLNMIENSDEETKMLHEMVSTSLSFIAWNENADKFFSDNKVVSSVSDKDITALKDQLNELTEDYKSIANKKLDTIKSEYKKMQEAENNLNKLFTSADRSTAKTSAKRSEYENAKKLVANLKQEDLKKEYQKSLEVAQKSIEEQERIAREKAEKARREREERQRKIAASWHKLNVSPYYINQKNAGVLNGCEAASLLMALKFKGYNRGMSFQTIVEEMPKSDDPNTGFYLSIYELGGDEAHWIAPAPLAAFGRSISGANVVNATGWSLDRLDEEVKNGNPVIIYLTWAFKNPKNYSKGVPKNLHVMVLSGYNSFTGDQQFHDPWPAGSAVQNLSKARTQELYRASGYRAVVVK